MRPQIVMKFGGTSVGTSDAIRRTARLVLREAKVRRPLVVVSALGGVTDLLLQAAATAKQGGDIKAAFDVILQRHEKIIRECSLPSDALEDLPERLFETLQGIRLLRELSLRTKDMIASYGERMSVRLTAAVLRSMGHESKAWDAWELGLITDERFGKAMLLPDAEKEIRKAAERLPSGVLPITTGYIGRSPSGEITTLGRGGSDFSAALFGAAIDVEEIQIWTDVPGILRADPRIVSNPSLAASVRFDEAAELAFFGAKVLHPRTIEPARKLGIPVRVLGTFHVDPDQPDPLYLQGTLIDDRAPVEPIRAIAIRKDVQSLHIHSLGMLEAPGFLNRIFEILARQQISVDVIATSEVSISMTFDRMEGDLEAALEEIAKFAQIEHAPQRCIVCLVGAGMSEDPTLLADVFRVLSDLHIPIHMISQGASRINLTFVTEPFHARKTMQALYTRFFMPKA